MGALLAHGHCLFGVSQEAPGFGVQGTREQPHPSSSAFAFMLPPKDVVPHSTTRGPQHSQMRSPSDMEELVKVKGPSAGLKVPWLNIPGANHRIQHLVE